jgi:hypothetical protein
VIAMATTKQDILNFFHTEFQQKTALNEGLENQFLLKAVADFELLLFSPSYNTTTNDFSELLSLPEQMFLGKLMYKHYLSREKDRILKLNNIVGKDISFTSVGQSKSTILKACENLDAEIERSFSRLTSSSFE